jgi:hypothetical protein
VRRREKLEQQLEDTRQKVTAYEDGEIDMPESTYMRYAGRVTLYMQKLERMKAMDDSVRNVGRDVFMLSKTEIPLKILLTSSGDCRYDAAWSSIK